jgi:hypothetical protein
MAVGHSSLGDLHGMIDSPIQQFATEFRRTLLFFAVLAPFLSGCSDSSRGVVSGTVSIDQQPVKSGSIAFFPVDEKSPTAGATISEGRFSCQVPLGVANVQIRVPKVVGQKKLYNTADSPVQPILHEVLPRKYNDQTELQMEVHPGQNDKSFDLTTK